MPVAALERLKQKYPQYAGIEDSVLADKLAAKYPQYAHLKDEVAKTKEVPPERTEADIAQMGQLTTSPKLGVGDFVKNTAKSMQNLGPTDYVGPTAGVKVGMGVLSDIGNVATAPFGAALEQARNSRGLGEFVQGYPSAVTREIQDRVQPRQNEAGQPDQMDAMVKMGLETAMTAGAGKMVGNTAPKVLESARTMARPKSAIDGSKLKPTQILEAAEQGAEVPQKALGKLNQDEIGRYTKLQKQNVGKRVSEKATKLDEDVKLLKKHLESKKEDAAQRIKTLAEGDQGLISRKGKEFEQGIEKGFAQGEQNNFSMSRSEFENEVGPKFKLFAEEGDTGVNSDRVKNLSDRIFGNKGSINARELYRATRDLPHGDVARNAMLDIAEKKKITAFRETNSRYADWYPTKRVLERDFRANQSGPVDFKGGFSRLQKAAYAPDKEVYIKEIENLTGEPLSKDLVEIVNQMDARKLDKAALSVKDEVARLEKQAFQLSQKEKNRFVPRNWKRNAARGAIATAVGATLWSMVSGQVREAIKND